MNGFPQDTPPPPPSGFTPPPGYAVPPTQPAPGFNPPAYSPAPESKRVVAGVCAILVGAFGVHKFVLGYKSSALIMLLGTILTCGIAGVVFSVIGLIEGIMYLTKSDEEFVATYQVGKKEWF